ncbi:hypothetical protein [Secundilactobacillus odoratitofui]|uniref:hypothetical protein n=1 Tax=Secundilactobacillus odoratitofui TaxID=480930 RepID=UPI000704B803|nr:hypothetical protein [Secundilactobacillus odoratitofui]
MVKIWRSVLKNRFSVIYIIVLLIGITYLSLPGIFQSNEFANGLFNIDPVEVIGLAVIAWLVTTLAWTFLLIVRSLLHRPAMALPRLQQLRWPLILTIIVLGISGFNFYNNEVRSQNSGMHQLDTLLRGQDDKQLREITRGDSKCLSELKRGRDVEVVDRLAAKSSQVSFLSTLYLQNRRQTSVVLTLQAHRFGPFELLVNYRLNRVTMAD